jgi:hypothetical protein
MKKGLIGLLLLSIIAITAIYIFIPASIRISKSLKLKGNRQNVYMLLNDSTKWSKWLEQDTNAGFHFTISKKTSSVILIEIEKNNSKIKGGIEFLPYSKIDTVLLYWHYNLYAGITPWGRLKTYIIASDLHKVFTERMTDFSTLFSKTENIYGVPIIETKVKDTLIATLTRDELQAPSEKIICEMILLLRQYINHSDVVVTDSAMTSIQKDETGKYKVMVGIPVNKIPSNAPNINIKKMMPGKLLIATVIGGPSTIQNGFAQTKKYITDYFLEEAALAYEVPVTDRCIEKDTAKWITKICRPFF